MNGFIYIIRNTVNQKVYIGQTKVSVNQRWKEHLRHAPYGDQLINRAMNKYGTDKFWIETLEVCNLNVIDEREKYYIALYDSTDKSKGYNVSIGGLTPQFERPSLPVETLIDLYVNKFWSAERIGKKFGVTRYIVTTTLRNQGVQIRDKHTCTAKFDKITKEQAEEAIKKTGSIRKAAKLLGATYTMFRKVCIVNNIEYNSSKSTRRWDYRSH